MADSYRNIAQTLLDRANLRCQSKGTSYDVIYTEQETLDRTAAVSKYPSLEKSHVPLKCIPGAKHPRCTYLILVDAYRTGGDDHHDNWTLLYRVDLQQFTADTGEDGFKFPDLLANDQAQTQYPYYDDSPDITWTFDVILVNPDLLTDPAGNDITDPESHPISAPEFAYTLPSQGTPHPLRTDALFLNETWQRSGPVLTVVRHYKKIAPQSGQSLIGYKISMEHEGFSLVEWTYDTAKTGYNPPPAGSACPINDPANPASLDFSTYKIIAPPRTEILDPLNLRVTLTYGAIPGPLIVMPGLATGPACSTTSYLQRRALGDSFSGAALKLDTEEVNGYSKVWKWTVPAPVLLVGSEVDMETGISYSITQILVPAGTLGNSVQADGTYSSVDALNTNWSTRTTRKATTLTSRSWDDIVNFSWPAVLGSISIFSVTNNDYPVRNIVRPNWIANDYSGPCRATITESWTQAQPPGMQPTTMITTPVTYDGVFLQVAVRACLHQGYTFFETSGTDNPSYDFFTHTEAVPATAFVNWPASIIGSVKTDPYRGGFTRRVTLIYRPS